MAITTRYPRLLLPPSTVTVTQIGRRDLGPASLDDSRQLQLGAGGFWQIELSGVGVWTPDQSRLWRAIASRLIRGRTVAIPVYDHRQAPFLPGVIPDVTAHADGTWFDDGTGYLTPAIVAELAVAAELRDEIVSIRMIRGAALKGGEYLSLTHPVWGECLYQTDEIVDIAGDVYTVSIWPGLREAAAAGDPVEFDDPRATCWLAADGAMADTRTAEIMTRRSVTMVEWNP